MGKPSFIVIGMERAGTTSLYANICQHPKVKPAYCKEIEYFDRYYDKGHDWYEMQFQDRYTGEATPTYYWSPVAAERIKKYNPDIKIILIRRNFEELVWSKYHQQVAKGVEKLSFAEALRLEHLRTMGELERTRALPYNYFPSAYCEYAYKGRYSESHFDKWKDFDLLELNQDYDMKTVFDFLELSRCEVKKFKLNSGSYPKMRDEEMLLIRGLVGEMGNSFAHDDLG